MEFTGGINGFYQRKTGPKKTIYFYVHMYENGGLNTVFIDDTNDRQ